MADSSPGPPACFGNEDHPTQGWVAVERWGQKAQLGWLKTDDAYTLTLMISSNYFSFIPYVTSLGSVHFP